MAAGITHGMVAATGDVHLSYFFPKRFGYHVSAVIFGVVPEKNKIVIPGKTVLEM